MTPYQLWVKIAYRKKRKFVAGKHNEAEHFRRHMVTQRFDTMPPRYTNEKRPLWKRKGRKYNEDFWI